MFDKDKTRVADEFMDNPFEIMGESRVFNNDERDHLVEHMEQALLEHIEDTDAWLARFRLRVNAVKRQLAALQLIKMKD